MSPLVGSFGSWSGIQDQTPASMMKLLSKPIERISSLSPLLTNYQFKSRQFIRRSHLKTPQHQRFTRLNQPIGLFRRYETPDPLLLPDIFKPEDVNQSPENLFQPLLGTLRTPSSLLYHVNDFTKTLTYIDGASSNNGSPHARAGCGIYRSPAESLNICRPLPIGTTNNRAELWAAVYALELLTRELTPTDAATPVPNVCEDDGDSGAVADSWIIASDSSYVVTGATGWAWERRAAGWKKKKKNASGVWVLGRGPVPNADLWDLLLRGIMNARGRVFFWLIRREWNRAHGLASRGAKLDPTLDDDWRPRAPILLGMPGRPCSPKLPAPTPHHDHRRRRRQQSKKKIRKRTS